MKINLISKDGNKIKEIETTIFDGEIREDVVCKIVEIEKWLEMPEYSPFPRAGMQTSASGNVRHLRHSWKSDRGRGMGRFPKKRMSRKGDRFVWIGAFVPGTRGGRRAHPPKLGRRFKKINEKEYLLGLKSALAMVSSLKLIKEKYKTIKDKELKLSFPLVLDSKVLDMKTKEFYDMVGKILGEIKTIAIQKKSIRSGKGKMRGRKYKKNAGVIFVIGNKEDKKINGLDIKKANDLEIKDLASNGARLSLFTEKAIKDLEIRLKLNKVIEKKK